MKRTITNVLLLCIVFAVIFGIVLYYTASCLMIIGLERRISIYLGLGISMILMMVTFKLTGKKLGLVEK